MRKHPVFLLCLAFWWWVPSNSAIANEPPKIEGPRSLQLTEGTELKIEKPYPLSIKDPDSNLKEVQLEVSKGTLSVKTRGKPDVKGGNTTEKTFQLTLSGDQSDINEALKSLTYKTNPDFVAGEDKLLVTSTDKDDAKDQRTIPITVTKDSAASKACDPNKKTNSAQGFWGYLSAGPSLSYSLVQYNLADKKSSLNAQAAGAGISIRLYGPDQLANFGERMGRPRFSLSKKGLEGEELTEDTSPPSEGQKWAEQTKINEVPSGCRAQTYEFYNEEKIHSWISFAPTMYAFQEKNADNFGVQFALNLGFLDDIFTIGVGWNLSGDNAGEWFILAGPSIGFGF